MWPRLIWRVSLSISSTTTSIGLPTFVNSLGWALAFRSGVGIVLAAHTLPPLVARMRAEEALLHAHFGPEYDAYRARTARLIPGIY